LSDAAIQRIATQLEFVRGQSLAVRNVTLLSQLQRAVECIGGSVSGVGMHNAVYLTLPDSRTLVVYPVVGVPTSVALNDAFDFAPGRSVAVVYDHIGLQDKWLAHLEWLGKNIASPRWVRASDAAWAFADWGGQ